MNNYFNSLTLRQQLTELGKCELLNSKEFKNGIQILKGKKIVIIGCGSQGLNQGLNMRDSGLDVSYTLRESAIREKRQSYTNVIENNFKLGIYQDMIPNADLVINLTPDKQHTSVVNKVMPLMKKGATLSYSHGFNIVEEGISIREDITVIMMAPKSPGSEVRQEYKRGFGVPTLIAVHSKNDPKKEGFELAKAYAFANGGNKAGVLSSSFIAEVKSDLMGEQTILCGVLQTGSLLCFNKMIEKGIDKEYAAKLIQYGWENLTEALKHGGLTNMMDRLSNPSKLKVYELAEELKKIMTPLFTKHMDDIMSGKFSASMMKDWRNNDEDLLRWRKSTSETVFEQTPTSNLVISEQEFFDHGTLLAAFIKAGVELAFEIMTSAGIKAESAYYESLHEAPLIANTIARKKLYEMNRIISDTAEYGCYLFNNSCIPLLTQFMNKIDTSLIGKPYTKKNQVKNQKLIAVNKAIRNHPIEIIGAKLRASMTAMK